jgi:hypothetical protein
MLTIEHANSLIMPQSLAEKPIQNILPGCLIDNDYKYLCVCLLPVLAVPMVELFEHQKIPNVENRARTRALTPSTEPELEL